MENGKRKDRKLHTKNIVKICLGLILLGTISLFGINGFVKYSAGKSIVTLEELEASQEEQPDAVIVLGAQVKSNGEMSLMLKERVETGIAIYKAGLADKIIMSGDHGQDN